MTGTPAVTELRLVAAAPDYEQALAFCRYVPGLPERAAYESPGDRVTILEAGRHPRTRRPAARGIHRSGREATWGRSTEWAGPVLLGDVRTYVRRGAFRNISFPRRIWGLSSMSFALATRPSYRLTTPIAEIEGMGVPATSVGRASGTRLVPAQPGYPGNGNRRCPSRRSS
jgi:hypothetical protein